MRRRWDGKEEEKKRLPACREMECVCVGVWVCVWVCGREEGVGGWWGGWGGRWGGGEVGGGEVGVVGGVGEGGDVLCR